MGGAQRDFVHGISTLIPKVTVTPATCMSQQFFRPTFSGKLQIHNFLDLGRKLTPFHPKVGITTLKHYSDRLLNFGCSKIQIEKDLFSKVHIDTKLIRPKPLGFSCHFTFKPPWRHSIISIHLYHRVQREFTLSQFGKFPCSTVYRAQALIRPIPLELCLHNTFKPPWTHLIMHGKLILFQSRGNSRAQLNSKRLTNHFQRFLRIQSMEYTSFRPYQPPWQQLFYSRKLLLLNPRGYTRFIATFQHLTLMKFSCSLLALLWMQGLHSLIHFNNFRCFSSCVQSNLRWDGSFRINHDQISAFQYLFIPYYGDCWNIVCSLKSTHTLYVNSGHISVQPTTHSISRDSCRPIENIETARICLPDTCQQINANISRYIYDG
jgi:hypothetical protein